MNSRKPVFIYIDDTKPTYSNGQQTLPYSITAIIHDESITRNELAEQIQEILTEPAIEVPFVINQEDRVYLQEPYFLNNEDKQLINPFNKVDPLWSMGHVISTLKVIYKGLQKEIDVKELYHLSRRAAKNAIQARSEFNSFLKGNEVLCSQIGKGISSCKLLLKQVDHIVHEGFHPVDVPMTVFKTNKMFFEWQISAWAGKKVAAGTAALGIASPAVSIMIGIGSAILVKEGMGWASRQVDDVVQHGLLSLFPTPALLTDVDPQTSIVSLLTRENKMTAPLEHKMAVPSRSEIQIVYDAIGIPYQETSSVLSKPDITVNDVLDKLIQEAIQVNQRSIHYPMEIKEEKTSNHEGMTSTVLSEESIANFQKNFAINHDQIIQNLNQVTFYQPPAPQQSFQRFSFTNDNFAFRFTYERGKSKIESNAVIAIICVFQLLRWAFSKPTLKQKINETISWLNDYSWCEPDKNGSNHKQQKIGKKFVQFIDKTHDDFKDIQHENITSFLAILKAIKLDIIMGVKTENILFPDDNNAARLDRLYNHFESRLEWVEQAIKQGNTNNAKAMLRELANHCNGINNAYLQNIYTRITIQEKQFSLARQSCDIARKFLKQERNESIVQQTKLLITQTEIQVYQEEVKYVGAISPQKFSELTALIDELPAQMARSERENLVHTLFALHPNSAEDVNSIKNSPDFSFILQLREKIWQQANTDKSGALYAYLLVLSVAGDTAKMGKLCDENKALVDSSPDILRLMRGTSGDLLETADKIKNAAQSETTSDKYWRGIGLFNKGLENECIQQMEAVIQEIECKNEFSENDKELLANSHLILGESYGSSDVEKAITHYEVAFQNAPTLATPEQLSQAKLNCAKLYMQTDYADRVGYAKDLVYSEVNQNPGNTAALDLAQQIHNYEAVRAMEFVTFLSSTLMKQYLVSEGLQGDVVIFTVEVARERFLDYLRTGRFISEDKFKVALETFTQCVWQFLPYAISSNKNQKRVNSRLLNSVRLAWSAAKQWGKKKAASTLWLAHYAPYINLGGFLVEHSFDMFEHMFYPNGNVPRNKFYSAVKAGTKLVGPGLMVLGTGVLFYDVPRNVYYYITNKGKIPPQVLAELSKTNKVVYAILDFGQLSYQQSVEFFNNLKSQYENASESQKYMILAGGVIIAAGVGTWFYYTNAKTAAQINHSNAILKNLGDLNTAMKQLSIDMSAYFTSSQAILADAEVSDLAVAYEQLAELNKTSALIAHKHQQTTILAVINELIVLLSSDKTKNLTFHQGNEMKVISGEELLSALKSQKEDVLGIISTLDTKIDVMAYQHTVDTEFNNPEWQQYVAYRGHKRFQDYDWLQAVKLFVLALQLDPADENTRKSFLNLLLNINSVFAVAWETAGCSVINRAIGPHVAALAAIPALYQPIFQLAVKKLFPQVSEAYSQAHVVLDWQASLQILTILLSCGDQYVDEKNRQHLANTRVALDVVQRTYTNYQISTDIYFAMKSMSLPNGTQMMLCLSQKSFVMPGLSGLMLMSNLSLLGRHGENVLRKRNQSVSFYENRPFVFALSLNAPGVTNMMTAGFLLSRHQLGLRNIANLLARMVSKRIALPALTSTSIMKLTTLAANPVVQNIALACGLAYGVKSVYELYHSEMYNRLMHNAEVLLDKYYQTNEVSHLTQALSHYRRAKYYNNSDIVDCKLLCAEAAEYGVKNQKDETNFAKFYAACNEKLDQFTADISLKASLHQAIINLRYQHIHHFVSQFEKNNSNNFSILQKIIASLLEIKKGINFFQDNVPQVASFVTSENNRLSILLNEQVMSLCVMLFSEIVPDKKVTAQEYETAKANLSTLKDNVTLELNKLKPINEIACKKIFRAVEDANIHAEMDLIRSQQTNPYEILSTSRNIFQQQAVGALRQTDSSSTLQPLSLTPLNYR